MTERELMQEAFEEVVDAMGFCLDQKWGDFENPYENSDTYLAYLIFTKAWQASTNREGYKLVPVEPNDKIRGAMVMHNGDIDKMYKAMIGVIE